MNGECIVLRVKENMFGEFNEAAQLKTSLAKYSIDFNNLAVQMRPHRIAYLRLLGRPYTLLYVRRSVGRLSLDQLSLMMTNFQPEQLDYDRSGDRARDLKQKYADYTTAPPLLRNSLRR